MSGRTRALVARLLLVGVGSSLPLVAPIPAAAGAGDIATYAGGVGAGQATQLAQVPEYLAISGDNLYISDSQQTVVRVLDTVTGRETVVAGNGRWGFTGDGGPATQAELSHPTGLALDSTGDLFISDTFNNRVREVKPNGIITLVAGIGLGGYSGDGGPATSAQLLAPLGLAVDAHDNLFIADSQNNAIRKVDMTTGIIQTVVASGVNSPADVTFDVDGNMFVADPGNARIAKVPPGGAPFTIAGGGSGGECSPCPALSAGLFGVSGIALDAAGNLLIADTNGNRTRKVDRLDGTGTITTVAGGGPGTFGGDGGPATAATLNRPVSVRANAAGELFIADKGNERVRKVDAGQTITTYAGTGGCGYAGDGSPAVLAQLCQPRGVVVDGGGDLFIADGSGNRIREVNASGTISTVAGNGTAGHVGDGGPATAAELNEPEAVTLDSAGNLFIADSFNNVVREVTLDGVIHVVAGNYTPGDSGDHGPATSAQLKTPTGVTFDSAGDLLIADYENHRIRRVDHVTNLISTIAGTGTAGFSGDGQLATDARLNLPGGIGLDLAGNLFIADSGNNLIRKVDSAGIISTVAGSFGAVYLGDGGLALNARLVSPFAVAVGPGNILYIDDAQDQRIRMVTPDGIIQTAAGNGAIDARGFSGDGGPAKSAALNDPYGLAVDSAGNIFIGDQGNQRVRRVEAYAIPGAPTNVVAANTSAGVAVTWTAPPSGGLPLLKYTVTPYQGTTPKTPITITGSPPPTSTTITGLTRGQTYTFVVTATNQLGTGPPSQASTPLTVYMAAGAPSAVQAVAGVSSAQVNWSAPSDDGGRPVLSYLVIPYAGSTALPGSTFTGSPALIQGLSNGTFYTFTVAATNEVGTGPASPRSNAVRPMAGGSYHPLSPARILDTRTGLGSVRAPLTSGQTRHITVLNRGRVPTDNVSAVVLNVTVTDTTGNGYLTVYPTGVTRPTASNLNWRAHQTVANLVAVAVGTGGQVDIYALGSSASVIFDVEGWVGIAANSGGADGLFNGLSPARILDTRDATGVAAHSLGANSALTFQVAGSTTHYGDWSGVPATGVSAVVLNVTVTNPTRSSYLTVYPTGAGKPPTSNLNFVAGQTVPNRVIVKLGTNGQVNIYNAAGTVNVIAEVNGWFTDGAGSNGGADFEGITPTRILDTRSASWGQGPLQEGFIYQFQVLDGNGNPTTGVSAIAVNVTATDATSAGYLTLFPDNGALSPPLASDLNFVAGQTVANLVVLQLGGNGFDIYNALGDTHVVLDVVGFYGMPDAAVPSSIMRGSKVAPLAANGTSRLRR